MNVDNLAAIWDSAPQQDTTKKVIVCSWCLNLSGIRWDVLAKGIHQMGATISHRSAHSGPILHQTPLAPPPQFNTLIGKPSFRPGSNFYQWHHIVHLHWQQLSKYLTTRSKAVAIFVDVMLSWSPDRLVGSGLMRLESFQFVSNGRI